MQAKWKTVVKQYAQGPGQITDAPYTGSEYTLLISMSQDSAPQNSRCIQENFFDTGGLRLAWNEENRHSFFREGISCATNFLPQ